MLAYIKMIEVGPVPNVKGGLAMLNRSKKAGYLAMGRYWFTHLRLQHFTNAAARRYNYAPREGDPGRPDPHGFEASYRGQKLKEQGHTRPLEKTGESQSQTNTANITATSKHVRLSMAAGWIGVHGGGHKIDMEEEFTAIDQRDADELAEAFTTDARRAYLREVGQAIELL